MWPGEDSQFDQRFLSQCGSTYARPSRSVPGIHWRAAKMLNDGTSSHLSLSLADRWGTTVDFYNQLPPLLAVLGFP